MSVREIIGRLSDAKRQVEQVAVVGGQAAATMTEASGQVNKVLDDVQDKTLGTSIVTHAQEVTRKAQDVAAISRTLDAVIQRYRGIGAGGR